MRAILSALASAARYVLDDRFLDDAWPAVLHDAGPHDALRETLARWSGSDAKPAGASDPPAEGRGGRNRRNGLAAAVGGHSNTLISA